MPGVLVGALEARDRVLRRNCAANIPTDAVAIRSEYCSVASSSLTCARSPVRAVKTWAAQPGPRALGLHDDHRQARLSGGSCACVSGIEKFTNRDMDRRRRCQMTLETREDIIERALLRLLAPQPATKVAHAKKKKFRHSKTMLREEGGGIPEKERLPAKISIIERLSSVTLSICWSDSTTGYFGEQVWRMGLAHGRSFCALSGMPIKIGDSVFRPWVSVTRAPANSHRMILASCVRVPTSHR